MTLVADLIRYLVHAMADAPWWAWPLSLITGLAAVLAAGWVAGRGLKHTVGYVRAVVAAAATSDRARRDQVGRFLQKQAMTILFGAVVAIVVGLSAQTLVGWLLGIGMSPMWARLAFVAFDGMAVMLALTLWRRVERGEATGVLRIALWGLVAASAYFCSQHAPDGNVPAAIAYALFPIVAALGLEVLLQEQRRDRSWLRRQAGEEKNRRLALVRWLHPVERVLVALEMARDEYMGADEATRVVRERAEQRRRDRVNRAAARAVWRLQRYRNAGGLRRLFLAGAERRAQAALDAAGLADDPAAMATVLRRVQVLTFADRLAALDYSTPADARRVTASLITEDRLGERLELTSGERTPEERSPQSERKPDAAAVSGERERPAAEPRVLLSDSDYERLLSAPPSDERAPIEPAAAHRSERSTAHSSTAQRRSLVAELLEENPDMTGPEIAEAVGARLGQPVSVATAKRDRAAVLKPE